VADALEAELSTAESESLAEIPTRNLDALAAYHAGSREFERRSRSGNDSIGVAELERAVALDPEFAPAWAKLAMMISWSAQISTDADLGRAREAIATAEVLAPGSAEVEMARGYYAYYAEREFDTALEHFRSAETLLPSDAQVVAAIGYILRRQGDWDGALRYMQRAIELDPRDVELYESLVDTLDNLRRYRTLDVIVERALVIDPRNAALVAWKIYSLAWLDGDYRRARSYAGELSPELRDEYRVAASLAGIAAIDGNASEARRLLNVSKPPTRGAELGKIFMEGLVEHAAENTEGSRQAGETLEAQAEGYPEIWSSVLSAIASALMYDTAAARTYAARANAEGLASPDHVVGPTLQGMAAQALSMVGDQADAAEILLYLATVPLDGPSLLALQAAPQWAGLRESPEWPAVLAAFEAAEAEGARLDTEAGF